MRAKNTKTAETAVLSDWQKSRLTRQERMMRSMLAPASLDLVNRSPERARWFCLVVRDGSEIAVGKRLMEGGVDTLVPTETVERRTAKGVKYEVELAFFVGYVFARFIPSNDAFERLRKVKSVFDFLRFGERYHEVRDSDLGFYLGDIHRLPKDKTIGEKDKVQIIYGPFSGVKAVVLQVLKLKSRDPVCRVWSELYQREIKNVPLAFLQRL
ncbi:transcription termination/antitermination protein NusG [Rhizobium rhizoryzae]|uniref:Transcriptional antiterminator NusG n=1 Tax=Rhizobium rhizoryzae TaxID=451876 RepID=A0A7W6PUB2_9HYPH|nr:transcription termination/antitermination NusG family protein [Rhizobium rhizoryzae]MBB4146037.1 transcriptional antiterminator NusG [Rhizobium rhizoryzae]